jgi:hypothetical protein
MEVPFTLQEFQQVFENYNKAVSPMQTLLPVIGVLPILLSFYKTKNANRIIVGIVALLWVWCAVAYHILFFSDINKAAFLFAALFILQAFLLYSKGVVENELSFNIKRARFGFAGMFFIFFSMFVYPVLSFLSGHLYPQAPTFGLPCPLTIYTFGCFLLMNRRFPFYLLIIPLLWSITAFTAVLQFKFYEDVSLAVAAIVMIILYTKGRKNMSNRRIVQRHLHGRHRDLQAA